VGALVGDGSTGRLAVYYAITTSPPPTGHRAWRTGESADLEGDEPLSARDLIAALEYPDDVDEIEVRVALSLIDVGSAAASLAEVETASYDDLRAMADDAWNRVLNRVRVRGGDDERKTRFYTSLYHAAMQPADGTELGGRFASAWGGEVEVFDAPGRYLSDDWCMWDTYRTSVPLRTLIEPEVARDQAWSLLHAYRQGGWLPKCPWFAAGYSRVMTGNPQVSALAEIAEIDPEGVDLPLLLEAVAHTSTADSNPFPSGLCGYLGLGTLPEYIANGFVSHECDPTQSASLTLEFAFADWAAARLEQTAEAAGVQSGWSWDPADRSASWRRHWDGSVGFMRGVNADGSWVEPFDPTSTADTNDFVEASAWVFSFFVPHDIPGLIELMGGREAFIARLDEFFDRGYFDPTNQPSFHIPYLYSHAGDWAGTARRVEETLARHYGVGRNGLPGNDDAGSTSAWLVLSELGIYPVAAGGAEYTLGVPGFDRAEVDVSRADEAPGTRWLVIERADVPTDELAGRWSLDGAELAGPTLPAARLLSGGLLAVE
ncbi:MAG: glycoside hydrolase family 92 protein, partial [Myxococcales bacterium]|nr:glycoside hydrolase family 92 protein [Myxococcales bacterium]